MSFIISVMIFFLMYIKPAKLICKYGPNITVHYSDFNDGGSFGLYLPVTFINTSSRIGTILNAAISINRTENPNEIYFINWKEFSKIQVDEKKKRFVQEELAHAMAVQGKSSVNIVIWFMWFSRSPQKLILEKGMYEMKFYYWSEKNKPPHCVANKFVITEDIYKKLEEYRMAKIQAALDIRLDREIDDNKLMTKHEAIKLLGKS